MSEEYTPPMEVAAGILAGKYSLSSVYVLATQIAHLTRERDEARAEVERLREENRILRATLRQDFATALRQLDE